MQLSIYLIQSKFHEKLLDMENVERQAVASEVHYSWSNISSTDSALNNIQSTQKKVLLQKALRETLKQQY